MSDLQLSSPLQAANVFGTAGSFPRQKHVFLARFFTLGTPLSQNTTNLTFAMKSIDRPKIQPKTELLNQYNKKRQIYTGYTIEPIRAQLYDSKDGAAQNMWADYSRYYFGDFEPDTNYRYDVTTPDFQQGNFGFSPATFNKPPLDPDTTISDQFYFQRIEIHHFYDGVVDEYDLINPRITGFEPDDLDYSNTEVSTISMTFVCENVQYFQQRKFNPSAFPEFDGAFWGDPLTFGASGSTPFPATFSDALNAIETSGGFTAGNPLNTFSSLFRSNQVTSIVNNFRSGNISQAVGALANFGNYSFGASPYSLSALASANPSLNSLMSLGSGGSSNGVNGAVYSQAAANIQGYSSGYGNDTVFANAVTQAQQIQQTNVSAGNSSGALLSPAAYAAVNAQQTGTAQYGYNPSASNTNGVAADWDGTVAGLNAINAADSQRASDNAAINAQIASNSEFA